MHGIQLNASNVFFILAPTINKKVVEAEVNFLAPNNC